jgi:hypothetical protein
MKHKMLRIEPRLAFINGVLLANRVLIFRFQLLAVYVLLVHNCGECRIGVPNRGPKSGSQIGVLNWGSILGVQNGGPYWGSILRVQNRGP